VVVLRAQDLVTPCKGIDDCCDGILCGINEGDCDSHEDCAGHLRCGVDNCNGSGFDSTDDCCWEDPLFLPGPEPIDIKKCEIVQGLEKKIAQAAVAQGCHLAKERLDSISLDECAQNSCSAELIGKSFTCNNQNKQETCMELLTLLDVMDGVGKTQCTKMLRTGETCTSTDDCSAGETCIATICVASYTWPFSLNTHLWAKFNDSAHADWVKHCRDDLNVTYHDGNGDTTTSHNGNGTINYICKEDNDTIAFTGASAWTLNGTFPVSQQYCKTCNATLLTNWCSQWSATAQNGNRGLCPDYCQCGAGDCNCCPLWTTTNSTFDNYTCCSQIAGRELHTQAYCKNQTYCSNATASTLDEHCFYPKPGNNNSDSNYPSIDAFMAHCPEGPKIERDIHRWENGSTVPLYCCNKANITNNYCTTHAHCTASTTASCLNICGSASGNTANHCNSSSDLSTCHNGACVDCNENSGCESNTDLTTCVDNVCEDCNANYTIGGCATVAEPICVSNVCERMECTNNSTCTTYNANYTCLNNNCYEICSEADTNCTTGICITDYNICY